MSTKFCSKCGKVLPSRAKFCIYCRSTSFKSDKPTKDKRFVCESCDTTIDAEKRPNFCPKCGRSMLEESELKRKIKMKLIIAVEGKTHKCGICMQEIKYGLIVCPSCLNTYHYNHLSAWILTNSKCPICKVRLELVDSKEK